MLIPTDRDVKALIRLSAEWRRQYLLEYRISSKRTLNGHVGQTGASHDRKPEPTHKRHL